MFNKSVYYLLQTFNLFSLELFVQIYITIQICTKAIHLPLKGQVTIKQNSKITKMYLFHIFNAVTKTKSKHEKQHFLWNGLLSKI